MNEVVKDDDILSRLKSLEDNSMDDLTPAAHIVKKYFNELSELRKKGICWRKIAGKIDEKIRYRTLSSAFEREEKRRKAEARKEASRNASKNKDKKIKKDNKPELPRMGYVIRQEGKSIMGDNITNANEKSDDVVNQDMSGL